MSFVQRTFNVRQNNARVSYVLTNNVLAMRTLELYSQLAQVTAYFPRKKNPGRISVKAPG